MRKVLFLILFCFGASGMASAGSASFKGIPIISLSMGYETSKVLNLRAGGGYSHWLDCKSNKDRYICGFTRLNHFYEFQYDPLNSTLGASANAAFVYVWGGLNLQMQYTNDRNGNNKFSLSPQLGFDMLIASIYIGPNFNIGNPKCYQPTTFELNLSFNFYAIAELVSSGYLLGKRND
jgi:hypothetical protein